MKIELTLIPVSEELPTIFKIVIVRIRKTDNSIYLTIRTYRTKTEIWCIEVGKWFIKCETLPF